MRGTMVAGPPTFRRLIIAADRCKGCELCVAACPAHVLAIDRSRVNVLGYEPIVAVDIGSCTSCALCARVCPDTVFTVLAPPPVARAGVAVAGPSVAAGDPDAATRSAGGPAADTPMAARHAGASGAIFELRT